MSYVLGFVVADGSVGVKRVKDNGKKDYYFNITSKDLSLLRKIKKVMGAEQKISSKKRAYQLIIGHKKISKDLLQLGIRPNKTYNHLGNIEVPEKYYPSFVRGFFDGDGSVYIYEVNGTPQLKSSFNNTNYSFLEELNQRLCKRLEIPTKNVHEEKRENAKNLYSIVFYIEGSEKLANFMYKDDPKLCLERKRKRFEEWESVERRDYEKKDYPTFKGEKNY